MTRVDSTASEIGPPGWVRSFGLVGLLLGVLFAGCAEQQNQSEFAIPPLRAGDAADVRGYTIRETKPQFRVNIEGVKEELLLDGHRGNCVQIRFVSEEADLDQRRCLRGETFEPVKGNGAVPHELPGFSYESNFGEYAIHESLNIALHASGRTWQLDVPVQSSWFGAPLEIRMESIAQDTANFRATYTLYSRAPEPVARSVVVLFGFRPGESLPAWVGQAYPAEKTFTPYLKLENFSPGNNPVRIPDPRPDWAGLRERLVSLGPGGYPDGDGCLADRLTFREMVETARANDAELALFLPSAYLIQANIGPPESQDLGQSVRQSAQLWFADTSGVTKSFLVERSDSSLLGRSYDFTRADDGTHEPIVPDDYPRNGLPYCVALGAFLSLAPQARSVYIDYYGSSDGDEVLFSGTSWGAQGWDLQISNSAGTPRASLSLITGTLLEA